LLFFAGITSSLAMLQPLLAFLEDEFGVTRKKAALACGAVVFALGFFCVWLYPGGAFDEFDYWSGTFALVVFALGEIFIFAYVFGMKRGWEELTRGADMRVPIAFRYVIKFVTPAFILLIFLAAIVKPAGSWGDAFGSLLSGGSWPFAADSVVGKVLHIGDSGYRWFNEAGFATRALVQDVTRLLLLLVFIACGVLVWLAWRRKGRVRVA
jgi:NSS family neurotransmitter:Na+ symporter